MTLVALTVGACSQSTHVVGGAGGDGAHDAGAAVDSGGGAGPSATGGVGGHPAAGSGGAGQAGAAGSAASAGGTGGVGGVVTPGTGGGAATGGQGGRAGANSGGAAGIGSGGAAGTGSGGAGGTANGGAGGGGGATSRTSIDYTGCDLATDIERIAVYRVDRAMGTCMVLLFVQGVGACTGGLVSGGWCLMTAGISTDVASCDKHQTPANVTAAVSMSGNFTFVPQTGGLIYGMDVTLQFPVGAVAAGGPTATYRLLAQACQANCTKWLCDVASTGP